MPNPLSALNRRARRSMLIAAALCAAAAFLWWLIDRDHVQEAASIPAAISAAAGTVMAVIEILRIRHERPQPPVPQHYRNRLRGLIEDEVGTEIARLGLNRTDYIEVEWTLNPSFSSDQTRQLFGGTDTDVKSTKPRDVSTLAADWRKHRQHLTLILGQKGSGKSTAAILLAHQLLTSQPESDNAEPIPVLIPISAWNPDEELAAWIERQLTIRYNLPTIRDGSELSMAYHLLRGGHLLPILDGFDEITASRAQDALSALRQMMTTLHRCKIVLTSRTEPFTEAMSDFGDRLATSAAVTLQPVDPAKAEAFLLESGPQGRGHWDAIIEQLRTRNSSIAQALITPLMVFLCRETYKAAENAPDTAQLEQFGNREAFEQHLISRFIPSRYQTGATAPATPYATPPPWWFRHVRGSASSIRKYNPDDAKRWLRSLAIHMDQFNAPDFEWWSLARATSGRNWRRMPPPPRLALNRRRVLRGLVVGLAFVLVVGLEEGLVPGLVTGLTAGLVTGLATGLVGVHTQSLLQTLTARQVLIGARNAVIGHSLILVLVFGLAGGLAGGTTGWIVGGLAGGLVFVLVFGLAGGLAGGLVAGLLLGLGTGLVFGLGFGLSTGLVDGMWTGLVVGLVVGLVYGVTGVLAGVLTAGDSHVHWLRYRLMHLRLARRHSLPWRLMDFLEHSHELGVLRRTGAAYEFRHNVLRRHLASSSTT